MGGAYTREFYRYPAATSFHSNTQAKKNPNYNAANELIDKLSWNFSGVSENAFKSVISLYEIFGMNFKGTNGKLITLMSRTPTGVRKEVEF